MMIYFSIISLSADVNVPAGRAVCPDSGRSIPLRDCLARKQQALGAAGSR